MVRGLVSLGLEGKVSSGASRWSLSFLSHQLHSLPDWTPQAPCHCPRAVGPQALGVLASQPWGTGAFSLNCFTGRCCSQEGAAVTGGLRGIKLIQLRGTWRGQPALCPWASPRHWGPWAMPPFSLSVTLGPRPGDLALGLCQGHVVTLAVPATKRGETRSLLWVWGC